MLATPILAQFCLWLGLAFEATLMKNNGSEGSGDRAADEASMRSQWALGRAAAWLPAGAPHLPLYPCLSGNNLVLLEFRSSS